MTDKQKKVLLLSLLAYTIGGFLFAVGIMLNTAITIITFYIIGLAMILSGILCLFNNYKLDKATKLYLYLSFIGIALAIFISVATYNQL